MDKAEPRNITGFFVAHPQFYFMRCNGQQSLFGAEGYHLAAASDPVDQQLDQTLTGLCQYQLAGGESPADLASTPVRLARLRSTNNELAIVHSTTRRRAEQERDSSFSHVILPEENGPTAEAVLRTWGMAGKWGDDTGWVSYGPDSEQVELTKELPYWEIPNTDQKLIGLASLWDFFQGERPEMDEADYNRTVAPVRLFTDRLAPFRRKLMHDVLTAFLREQRIILRGEPGLAALLIFGVTQLLPEYLTTRLTFSTYESATSCKSSELDITNTTESCKLNDSSCITIDTFEKQDNTDAYEITAADTASQYSKFVLSNFCNCEIPDIQQAQFFWNKIAIRHPGDEEPNIHLFLEDWGKYFRIISNEDSQRLKPSEIHFYINDPRYQAILFKKPLHNFDSSKQIQISQFVNQNLSHWQQWWRELKKSEPEILPDDFHVPLSYRMRFRLWKYQMAAIAPLTLIINTFICIIYGTPEPTVSNISFYVFQQWLVVILLATILLCLSLESVVVYFKKPSREEILDFLRFRERSSRPVKKARKRITKKSTSIRKEPKEERKRQG